MTWTVRDPLAHTVAWSIKYYKPQTGDDLPTDPDFARIFGIILEVFFMKNVVLPAWELIFQKFRRISWFLFCWRAFQK